MKKVKKYADGGMAGAPGLTQPRMQSSMGLTGIRDAASDLIGTAQNVSQMSQSLVGGGGGGGFSDIAVPRDRGVGTGPFGSNAAEVLGGLGVKAFKKGGKVSSASKRGDGIAQRGKTRGRMV